MRVAFRALAMVAAFVAVFVARLPAFGYSAAVPGSAPMTMKFGEQ